MRPIIFILLLAITGVAHAEIYKCYSPEKQAIYQSTPCSVGSENKNVVAIDKLTPRQIEEAENRLKATVAERAAIDKAAQEKRDAATAQWNAEAPQREAAAARQEAAAARQEAAEAKRQMEMRNNGYPSYMPYSNGYHHPRNPVITPYVPPIKPNYSPNFSPYNIPIPNPNFSPYTPTPPVYNR
jgi:hypothetical protein